MKLDDLGRAARRFSWLSTVPIIGLLVWLGSSGNATLIVPRSSATRTARCEASRISCSYLAEWLTILAQMGATTGERPWTERYEQAVPGWMRRSWKRPSSPRRRGGRMERRSLSLGSAGDFAAAKSLLNGPEYAYLQDVYATGASVLNQALGALAYRRAADLAARTWLETGGFGLCAILLGATALSVRSRKRLPAALARAAAAARKSYAGFAAAPARQFVHVPPTRRFPLPRPHSRRD